jgi:hypothetical protein
MNHGGEGTVALRLRPKPRAGYRSGPRVRITIAEFSSGTLSLVRRLLFKRDFCFKVCLRWAVTRESSRIDASVVGDIQVRVR